MDLGKYTICAACVLETTNRQYKHRQPVCHVYYCMSSLFLSGVLHNYCWLNKILSDQTLFIIHPITFIVCLSNGRHVQDCHFHPIQWFTSMVSFLWSMIATFIGNAPWLHFIHAPFKALLLHPFFLTIRPWWTIMNHQKLSLTGLVTMIIHQMNLLFALVPSILSVIPLDWWATPIETTSGFRAYQISLPKLIYQPLLTTLNPAY